MLSSTFSDLKEHRESVQDALLAHQLFPIAMENDGALPDLDLIGASLAKVEQAVAYVGLISHRYGQTPPCPERNPKTLSLTELEFRRARERGIPICMFIMDEDHPVKPADVEPNARKKKKLNAFRKLASEGRIYATFNSVDDLKAKAMQSLPRLRTLLDQQAAASQLPAASPPGKPEALAKPAARPIPEPPAFFAMPDYIPGHKFVGRTREIVLLNEWATSDDPVLIFEAIGGMGKSMLTWQWVREHARAARSDWAGVFWYSFYERGADMSDFCAHALAYTTGRPLEDFRGRKTAALSHELVNVLHQRPWLFVLDGLERVLVAYHRIDAAQLPDEQAETDPDRAGRRPEVCIKPADDELLRMLCSCRPSKLLMSSRLMPRPLLNNSDMPLPGVKPIKLLGLDPADAERMLRAMQIRGDSTRIQVYLEKHFGSHPLVVGVVAGLVANYRPAPSDFDRWADDPLGGADPQLAEMDLVQKRNHILKAAFDTLTPEARTLLDRLALISDAVDYPTLDALNPHRPEPPQEVSEPRAPDERRNWELRKLKDSLSKAEVEDERSRLHQKIDELKARLQDEYAKQKAAYETYQADCDAWQRSPEYRAAPKKLARTLKDLESRGLLQWNRELDEYDLHPVVRGYAVSSLPAQSRAAVGQSVVDHFSSRSDPPYENATSLDDLRNGLQVVRTLIQVDEYNNAAYILTSDLGGAIFWNLEAFHEFLAIIRPLFPDGWESPPRDLGDDRLSGRIANDTAIALDVVGRPSDAIKVQSFAILTQIKLNNIYAITIYLNNIIYIIESNSINISKSFIILDYINNILPSCSDHIRNEEIIFLNYKIKLNINTYFGNYREAESAWEKLDPLPCPTDRMAYRPGDREVGLARLRLLQGRLDDTLLASARWTAEDGKNRGAVRELHKINGEWMLTLDRWTDAEAAFDEAITMAREVGLATTDLEARLALAQAKQGRHNVARATADRLADHNEPPHVGLAELYLALDDHEKAHRHVIPGYRWAWADGEPYVIAWPLQRCRKVLEAIGEPEPQLPPFDESKHEPLPFEAELQALIEKLKREREEKPPDPGVAT